MPVAEGRELLIEGPWRHRSVTANGIRLQVAEAGEGPLIILLHGFPQFWWMWRHQIPALSAAGYQVVAADLRGFGGSDKPPRSYDPTTVAGDVAGLIRALGHSEAVLVGHDLGGLVAWTVASLHPGLVRGLCAMSAPHPRRLRRELVTSARQVRGLAHVFEYQVPRLPEAKLVRDDAAYIETAMRMWAGQQWRSTADFADAVRRYRQAIQVPQAAYGACEYFRWMVRSLIRPDGLKFVTRLRRRIPASVLHLHGTDDACVLARTAEGSSAYVTGPYAWHVLPGVGHFPAEEAPAEVNQRLLDWLGTLPPASAD